MKDLPVELVGVIAKNLSSPSDLLSFRSVNSTCQSLVTPLLFHTIRVGNSVQSAQNCQSVLASPSLALHVREVIYDQREHVQFCLIPPSVHDDCDELELAELEDALTEAFCSLSGFKNLESISLNFWPSFCTQSGSHIREHPFWFANRQIAVLHAVHHAMKQPLSTIRSLSLSNVVLMSSACYDFVSTVANAPLHHFSMSVIANSELGVWSGSKALNGPLSSLLPPTNPNLKSLILRSPQGLHHSLNTQLGPHDYPVLEMLVLENIVFDPTPSVDGIEEFIIRHKASLRRLEIHSCSTYVPSFTTPLRKWSAIWKRLEEELVCLTELVISDVRPSYTLLDGTHGYVPYGAVPVEDVKEDEEAYLQLSDRVNRRSILTGDQGCV